MAARRRARSRADFHVATASLTLATILKKATEHRTYLRAPKPTDVTLEQRTERRLEFPDGRIMNVTMSVWHWQLADFLDQWSVDRGYEHSVYYEWLKRRPNTADTDYGNGVMLLLREKYNKWLEDYGPEGPKFLPPGNKFGIPPESLAGD